LLVLASNKYNVCLCPFILGKNKTIIEASDKIAAFQKRLLLWKRRIPAGVTDMFPLLTEYIDDGNMSADDINDLVMAHLTDLNGYFESYFGDIDTDQYDWMRDPFNPLILDNHNLPMASENELISLSSDRTLKLKLSESNICQFWASVEAEYPELYAQSLTILLPFPTSYLCETSFSAMAAIKTKFRSRLHVEDDLRVCLSAITPRIKELCASKQAQTSH
jgi:hypothetical protein